LQPSLQLEDLSNGRSKPVYLLVYFLQIGPDEEGSEIEKQLSSGERARRPQGGNPVDPQRRVTGARLMEMLRKLVQIFPCSRLESLTPAMS